MDYFTGRDRAGEAENALKVKNSSLNAVIVNQTTKLKRSEV